jgi:precorrin-6B methylase 2
MKNMMLKKITLLTTWFAFSLICGFSSAAIAQETETTSPKNTTEKETTEKSIIEHGKAVSLLKRYAFNNNHDPNGIGKFYMGREIAHVMGFSGSPWLERSEREEEEKLTKLVELLDLKPGMNVADIGAGTGVITFMMSPLVLPKGNIFAVDIQQEMLDVMREKAENAGIKNVKVVKGAEKSPMLRENTIDLALFVDVYHELKYPYEVLLELSKDIKKGGRLVLVEYRMEDPAVPIKLVHKMSQAQAKKELELPELGFKWIKTFDDLPRQHIIVFERQ